MPTEETGRWDAVFVDRDGTLNVAPASRYVSDPGELVLLPGAAAAVAALNTAGIPVMVVTNQQGVATGVLSEAALAAVHGRMVELLAAEGAHLDGIYVCPHLAGTCDCRKPQDGLLRRAFREHPTLRPGRCAFVGDSMTDVAAGSALGLHRVLLVGEDTDGGRSADQTDATAPDLLAAVRSLLVAAPRA